MKKLLKIKDNDSGIAIMFSLMMLAVFLVLGMGFSAYMSNIRRAAEYQKTYKSNKDIEDVLTYQIRLALKGGFDVLGQYPDSGGNSSSNYTASMPEGSLIKFYGFTQLKDNSNNLITMPDDGSTEIDHAVWGVETSTPDHAIRDTELKFPSFTGSAIDNDAYLDNSTFNSPNGGYLGWQEHKDENDEIYAISTWALMAMSGRLDPGAVSTSASTPASRSAGKLINEISSNSIMSTAPAAVATYSTSTITDFQKGLHDAGESDDTAYFSFFPLGPNYTIEMLNESDVLDTTDKAMATDTDGSNDVTLYDLSSLATATSSNNSTIVNTILTGIPYLPNDPTGQQIAANINDYLDGDDNATLGGTEATPTYVGNEAVPYLNEIKISARVLFSDSGTATANALLNVAAQIETVQLYTLLTTLQADSLSMTLNVSFIFDNGVTTNAKTGDLTFNFTNANIISGGTNFTTSPAYYQSATNSTPTQLPAGFLSQSYTGSPTFSSPKVSGFTINSISSIVLKDGTDLWDIATLPTPPAKDIDDGDTESCTFQCKDPKFNLDSTSWDIETGDWQTAGAGGDLGSANGNYTRVANDGDNDVDSTGTHISDPIDLSTNFIRNGAMLNLHELGYIHRASTHKTLNLIEYNTATPETMGNYTNSLGDKLYNSANTFASLSDGGDRSMLDYVSLGTSAESTGTLEESTPNQGRINPNTNHPAVLKALFTGISAEHPDPTVTSPRERVGASAGNTAISETKILSLISNFPGINTLHANLPLRNDAGTDAEFPSIGYFDPLWFKNLKNNPASYGVPFKLTPILNDREAEVLLCNTRRFVSVNRNYYIASLAINSSASDATYNAARSSSAVPYKQYLVRELIDDAKDGTDTNRTPHDPSDDRYRVRIMRQF